MRLAASLRIPTHEGVWASEGLIVSMVEAVGRETST
jgi:hypothetical protein